MSGDESLTTLRSLLKELDLEETVADRALRDLREEFGALLKLSPPVFLRVGLDVSIVVGVSGDWNLALEFVQRLIALNDDRLEIKIWQLRCLVESERFAEALALSGSVRWKPELMLHVNYLTGLAFEALNMVEQARLRFEAVSKIDPSYRNVSQRM
jgi:hypothetical protein